MRFLIKHLIICLLVFLLLIALAVMGKILWSWYVFSLFLFLGIVWIIGYFPFVIWLTYKKLLEYALSSREIINNKENREMNVKNLLVNIADEEFGLPQFITNRIVAMIDVKKITQFIIK